MNESCERNGNHDYLERYALVYDYQERDAPMHAEYASIIEQFLYCQFDDITSIGFDNAVEEVTQAIRAYSQHPGLHISGHIAHHRLADLYLVHSLFHALHRQALAVDAQGSYAVGQRPEMPCNYDYLSKRQLQHLWANLLGVS